MLSVFSHFIILLKIFEPEISKNLRINRLI